jgi:dCMP deaminase
MENKKHIKLFMDIANTISQMSVANKLKVGSVIVKNSNIIGFGWNGTPSGWDNTCDDPVQTQDGDYVLKTRPEVIHSESNAILKVARSTESTVGATMFCTHSPCLDCAKLIFQSGINTLYYRNQYRSTDGIEFLKKSNVEVVQLDINN